MNKQIDKFSHIKKCITMINPNYEYQNQSLTTKDRHIKHLILRKITGNYVFSSSDNNHDDYLGIFPGTIEKIARVVIKDYSNKVEIAYFNNSTNSRVSLDLLPDGYISEESKSINYSEGFNLNPHVSNIGLQMRGSFEKNKKYTIERYVYGYCIQKNDKVSLQIIDL